MRAHFDIPASPDTDDGEILETKDSQKSQSVSNNNGQIAGGGGNGDEELKSRIMEFKSDSSKMAVLGEFIDEVLEKAEEEANKQQGDTTSNSQQLSLYQISRMAKWSTRHEDLWCVSLNRYAIVLIMRQLHRHVLNYEVAKGRPLPQMPLRQMARLKPNVKIKLRRAFR
ncbi:uncharacterized protein isoform X3 [Musca autumnalis]|uniref:uncharacterized protein isoform X3 n=1 Tax=Musca autumnalis TaxID=221902 RepID=UPI003CE73AB3